MEDPEGLGGLVRDVDPRLRRWHVRGARRPLHEVGSTAPRRRPAGHRDPRPASSRRDGPAGQPFGRGAGSLASGRARRIGPERVRRSSARCRRPDGGGDLLGPRCLPARPDERRESQPLGVHDRGGARGGDDRPGEPRRDRDPRDRHGRPRRRASAHRRGRCHPVHPARRHDDRCLHRPGAVVRRAHRDPVRYPGLPVRARRHAARPREARRRPPRAVRGPACRDRPARP